ncbi:MAG: hypothetical protein Q7K55_04420 [Candidatus Levybacteria bacterium]|nr:hypothetical protein [Candidatus Levybacteria bacterium]
MDKQVIQAIREVLDKNEQIAIAVGKNPNLDEMGAALALYLCLQLNNKKVTIVSPSDPIVELSSLVGINKLKASLGEENGDLVVSFPYKEGEIEKVSYTLESGSLNIIVKAGESGLSFSEREVEYKRSGGTTPVLFIVGTPRLSDLGNIFNPENLKNTTVINIDNKRENQGFGDVTLVYPNLSSVSEIVASIIEFLNLESDIDISQNLFSGISFATDNFQKPDTSFLAFEMAGVLMKNGAIRTKSPVGKNFMPQNNTSFLNSPDFTDEDSTFDIDSFDDPFTPPQQNQNALKFKNAMQNRPLSKAPASPFRQSEQSQQYSSQQNPQAATNMPGRVRNQQAPQNMQKDDKKEENAPTDWLTPKIYKGSSNV